MGAMGIERAEPEVDRSEPRAGDVTCGPTGSGLGFCAVVSTVRCHPLEAGFWDPLLARRRGPGWCCRFHLELDGEAGNR